jgi:hypothetical protein
MESEGGGEEKVSTTGNILSELVDDQIVESHAEPQNRRNKLRIPTWKVQENKNKHEEVFEPYTHHKHPL